MPAIEVVAVKQLRPMRCLLRAAWALCGLTAHTLGWGLRRACELCHAMAASSFARSHLVRCGLAQDAVELSDQVVERVVELAEAIWHCGGVEGTFR